MKHDIKQVIVMRTDLNMRKGKMIAQGAHAAMAVILKHQRENNVTERMKLWLDESFKKIVVSVNSQEAILKLANEASLANIPYYVIVDNGATEFHGEPTITCMAIGPDYSDLIDKLTGELPLL